MGEHDPKLGGQGEPYGMSQEWWNSQYAVTPRHAQIDTPAPARVRVRIEDYDDWCRLLVDDKVRAEGHTSGYIYSDLLDLLGELGATVETEYFAGEEHGEAQSFYDGPYHGEGYPDWFKDDDGRA
jgi:hypothetical protein